MEVDDCDFTSCGEVPAGHHRASLAEILAKRNQKAEVRKAQREQAIRAAKEAKKAKQVTKKQPTQSAKAPVKAAAKQKIAKPMKVSAPRVGGKR